MPRYDRKQLKSKRVELQDLYAIAGIIVIAAYVLAAV